MTTTCGSEFCHLHAIDATERGHRVIGGQNTRLVFFRDADVIDWHRLPVESRQFQATIPVDHMATTSVYKKASQPAFAQQIGERIAFGISDGLSRSMGAD